MLDDETLAWPPDPPWSLDGEEVAFEKWLAAWLRAEAEELAAVLQQLDAEAETGLWPIDDWPPEAGLR